MAHRRRSGVFRWAKEDSFRRPFEVKITRPGHKDNTYNPPPISGSQSPTSKFKKESDKKWIKHEGKWIKC